MVANFTFYLLQFYYTLKAPYFNLCIILLCIEILILQVEDKIVLCNQEEGIEFGSKMYLLYAILYRDVSFVFVIFRTYSNIICINIIFTKTVNFIQLLIQK